jgi:hypothetical protein
MKNRSISLLVSSLIFVLAQVNLSNARAEQSEFLKTLRNHGDIQGLSEVQLIAASYVSKYNQKHQTRWIVGEPNFKILVHRCKANPIVKQWVPQSSKSSNIIVSCSQTVAPQPTAWSKNWEIEIPVFRR